MQGRGLEIFDTLEDGTVADFLCLTCRGTFKIIYRVESGGTEIRDEIDHLVSELIEISVSVIVHGLNIGICVIGNLPVFIHRISETAHPDAVSFLIIIIDCSGISALHQSLTAEGDSPVDLILR